MMKSLSYAYFCGRLDELILSAFAARKTNYSALVIYNAE